MGEWIIEDRYMDDVFMVSGWMDRWMDAGWVSRMDGWMGDE